MRTLLISLMAAASIATVAQASPKTPTTQIVTTTAMNVEPNFMQLLGQTAVDKQKSCQAITEANTLERDLIWSTILTRALSKTGFTDLGSLAKAGADLERAHERLREEFCTDLNDKPAL